MLIGLDVGGTKALGLLIEPETGAVVGRHRASSAGSPTELVATLAGLVELLRTDSEEPITAVGLGIAGLVNRDGTVRYSPNLPTLVEAPIAALVAEAIGQPVCGINDATAGTWAEARAGAGRGSDDLLYVALGTGIGVGLVVHGQLALGANGFAGEAGHMSIDIDGPPHITGQRGAWEHYASGNGLGRRGREAASAGDFPAALDRVDSIDELTGYHVVELLRAEDPGAMGVFDGFCRDVAHGIANLIVVLDPDRIVIGGGLADIGEPLRAGVEYWVGELLVGADHRPIPEITIATLGSDAAAIGAALHAGEVGAG